jgi:hypothetical protein
MAKSTKDIDRAVRIELLRARAAIERETLVQDIAYTANSLKPGNLIKGLLPSGTQSNFSNILWQGVSLARRYPFVSSTLSALVMGRGKRTGFFKLASGALLGWQAWSAWRNTRESSTRNHD